MKNILLNFHPIKLTVIVVKNVNKQYITKQKMHQSVNHGAQNMKKRLRELHKWQEEQQRVIDQRQTEQRLKLGIEQKELYSQLGIFPLVEDRNGEDCESLENQFILEDIPKRKFLKRGEGLKNRFKIDPDTLRLHNLPKYKYAKSQNSFKQKQKKDVYKKKNSEFLNDKNKTEFKVNNNELSYVNCPIFEDDHKELDESECESFSANREFNYVNLSTEKDNYSMSKSLESQSPNCNKNFLEKIPITWAKVLNSYPEQCPKEIYEPKNSELSFSKIEKDEIDNLSIFELLEKKTQQGSFNINASLIQKWIKEKATALLESSKEVEEKKKIKQIEKLKISPVPFDIENKIIPVESNENSETSSLNASDNDFSNDDENSKSLSNNDQVDKFHVRFCEEVEVNQVKSEEEISPKIHFYKCNTEDRRSNEESQNYSGFEKFKANLFKKTDLNEFRKLDHDDSILIKQLSTVPLKNEEYRREILEKTELLKSRLVELEKEIISFKENNAELLKLKQQHELDKIQLENDRLEMQEKFNDEKIKYEIHLHDEKLKIEDEKKKIEIMIRDYKTPKKRDKEEILKLKEEIEFLHQDKKNRESKHIAAQARLRAQIRNLEKEVKDFSFEIDNLKKDNKKLETENARMIKQNNNKMLQEINKTIAKLTTMPAQVPASTEIVKNQSIKTAFEKVKSHKRNNISTNKNIKSNHFKSRPYEQNDNSSSDENSIYTSSSSDENRISQKQNKVRQLNSNTKATPPKLNESCNKSKIFVDSACNYKAKEFKREIEHPDGSKDIWYPNGNLKKISADGMNIKMLYFNKDIKDTNVSEGTVRYYYAEKNTWHTTYLDGLEILEFPNGQKEHRHKDGTVEVHFPNGSIRISNPSDQHKLEEWRYTDGTNCIQLKTGDKILSFPNGQKEVHTKIHKRREYPDGTVKLVYPDGSQETRYSNGRIRLKDKNGSLIMDSENNKF